MRFPFEMVPFLGDIREFAGGYVLYDFCDFWEWSGFDSTFPKGPDKSEASRLLPTRICLAGHFFGGLKKSVVKKIDKQTQSNKALKQRNQGECA